MCIRDSNIQHQSIPTGIPNNSNHQPMQYNPDFLQCQQPQFALLEEQNRLAAEAYPQQMVQFPQGNIPNDNQRLSRGRNPMPSEGMVLDPMTGQMVPAGGMGNY